MKKNIRSIGLDDPEKLYQFVERHLAPKEYEKKEFGEVFTPLWLVEQMLDKVPDEVWHNPQTKILDPAAGIGNFPIIAYKKLMEGLKDKIKDAGKRKKHILENMLYMVELNPVNSAIMNRLLGGNTRYKKNGYDLNIVTDSFFHKDKEEKKKLVPKNKKIDLAQISYTLIMGNPPYNASQDHIGKRGGGSSLWPNFVNDSLSLIDEKGFLSFVHPPGWRKPESDQSKNKGLFKMMAHDCTPLYIEIHDASDGIKTFNAGTRYDWYIIKKIKNIDYESIIINISGKLYKIKLSTLSWLPNSNFNLISKIISQLPKYDSSRIIYNNSYESRRTWVSDKKTSDYKYTLIHSTVMNGVICKYSSRNDLGHFSIPKVIFGESGINMPVLDLNGDYGMTNGSMAIPIKNKKDGILLINYLRSDPFRKILNSCMWENFRIDWRLFAYLKDGFWRSYETFDSYVDQPLSCMQKKTIKK